MGINEKIVSQSPTADLWEGQTDEEELGMTYSQLDALLRLHIEMKHQLLRDQDITLPLMGCVECFVEDEFNVLSEKWDMDVDMVKANFIRITQLVARTEHKRILPPSYKRT